MADLPTWKRVLLVLLAFTFVLAGLMHFVVPELYEQIVPPALPARRGLVLLSGVAEIALGLGVIWPRTRVASAWGLVALLVAVFPANVYMATSGVEIGGLPAGMAQPTALSRWARLPFQALFIAWAWLFTRGARARA